MADEDRTFTTTEVEANRAAQQGLGVGQRELDAERDPGEPASVTAELDDAAEDLHAANRQRSADKTEAERAQGAKTRQHNKDTVSRRT